MELKIQCDLPIGRGTHAANQGRPWGFADVIFYPLFSNGYAESINPRNGFFIFLFSRLTRLFGARNLSAGGELASSPVLEFVEVIFYPYFSISYPADEARRWDFIFFFFKRLHRNSRRAALLRASGRHLRVPPTNYVKYAT